MTGRHRLSQPMHTDDPVAPGIRRVRAGWITAAGLAGMLAAIMAIVLVLDQKATTAQKDASLSSDEVRELREFLADRGEQRDAERAATQVQLDDQRRALCTAIQTLSAAAKPRGRAVLDKAAKDLSCARVSATPNVSSSRATGRPSVPTDSSSTPTTGPRADPPQRPEPNPVTSPPVARQTTAVRRPTQPTRHSPGPSPAPSPSTARPPIPAAPPADGPDLLDPVTDPICKVTGVYL